MSRRLRELTVMLGHVAFQHGLRLSFGLSSGQSQLTDKAILQRSPESLDPSFSRGDPARMRLTPRSSTTRPTSVLVCLLTSCS